MLQFLPLIMQGAGLLTSIFGGISASQENARQRALQEEQMRMMKDMLAKMQSESSIGAYQNVARQGFDDALGGYAARGLGSSGVAGRGLGSMMANAAMQAQNARVNALGQVFSGSKDLAGMYGQNINPNPFGGVASSLGAIGQTVGNMQGQGMFGGQSSAVPAPAALTNYPLPTSGYTGGNPIGAGIFGGK